ALSQSLRAQSTPQLIQDPQPTPDLPQPSPTFRAPRRTLSAPACPPSAVPANPLLGTRTATPRQGCIAGSAAFFPAAARRPFPSTRNLPDFRSSKSNPPNAASPALCSRSPKPPPPPARS